jgi:hypothetical protein
VLPPESGLRQWELTFPFAWRATLSRNGALLGSLTRIFEETAQGFTRTGHGRKGAMARRQAPWPSCSARPPT